MTEYAQYPSDATYLRPLEPRRSRMSTTTGATGPPRQSTVTWISQSQFPTRMPPPILDVPTIPSLRSRDSYDAPHGYGRNTPADRGPEEDEFVDEPITPGGTRSEAEHMTVDPADVEHDAGPSRARGSFVGGFMRKVFGKGGRPETEETDFRPAPYTNAPLESYHPRDVTYVDTASTGEELPPRRPLYSQYTGASGLPSVQEQDSPEMRDQRSELGSEQPRSQGRRSQEGTAVNEDDEYERQSHDAEAVRPGPEGPDLEGVAAVHHGVPFHPAMMNSPVFNEPLPTSDYDKMSAFHTAPSELYSLTSYIDRVALFCRDLYDLPWVSTRVAADYIPGENSRSKYYRFKMRHATQNGSLGLNSWYALPTHQDLDLLEGEGSQAGGPNRNPYPSTAYPYPGNYPSAYSNAPPHPRYAYEYAGSAGTGTGTMEEREYVPSPPRSNHSHGESQPSQPPERAISPPQPYPPNPGWAPHVTIQASTPPRSYASPRTDRTIPTISHTMRSPPYGGGSTLAAMSPRTDRTIDTYSHTAISTVRGPGRERGTAAGTAGSEVSAPGGDGRRPARVSWYSSNEGTPTTPTQPLYGYTPPSSPPPQRGPGGVRRHGSSGIGRHGSSGLARYAGGGSLSARSDRSAGGRSADGGIRSANGSDNGTAPGAWPQEMRQTQQMPVILSAPTPSPPASPPRLATTMGSPRRNRYEHYSASGYTSPPRTQPLPFAMNRG